MMKERLQNIKDEALKAIEAADMPEKLNDVRVKFLGKKGELTAVLKGMKDVAPEDRPKVGQMVNETRAAIEAVLEENKEKMEEAFHCGLEQAEKILQDICWEEYEDILFVSKSIGTVISSAFARRHQLSAKNILFTPLQQTFLFADGNGIVFHGTADPWADTKDITEGCKNLNLPLILTDEGNHSLETGDTLKDLENLQQIIGLLFNSLDK